jgi:hypothetical protein
MYDATRTATLRSTAVLIGLAGIIAVHAMDLTGKMQEVPYLGLMYIGVIAAAALAGSVIVGFVVNRTVGMPGAMDDTGNWWEPLGLLSLMVEAWVVWQALAAARGTGAWDADEETAVRRAHDLVSN